MDAEDLFAAADVGAILKRLDLPLAQYVVSGIPLGSMPEALRAEDSKRSLPLLHGALLKNEQDVMLFEQLVFLHRRAR